MRVDIHILPNGRDVVAGSITLANGKLLAEPMTPLMQGILADPIREFRTGRALTAKAHPQAVSRPTCSTPTARHIYGQRRRRTTRLLFLTFPCSIVATTSLPRNTAGNAARRSARANAANRSTDGLGRT